MGNFQGGNRGGSGGGFRGGNGGGNRGGGYRGGNNGDREEKTMYKAICDECHKSCEVPFRPSSDKPVYCNDCFSSKRKDDDRGPRRDFNNRPPQPFMKSSPIQGDMSKQLGDINAKLDRLINAMEKLTQPAEKVKPVIAKVVAKKPITVKAVVKKVVAKKKK